MMEEEKLVRKMAGKCLHYFSCHYDNITGESLPCPHYWQGLCELSDSYPQIFPKKCIGAL
jgi:hypothetical protein